MMAKLERFVFYIFVVALPFQTRVILKMWGNGFNEWNSAYLYATDILILALFLFWLIRKTDQGSSGDTFVSAVEQKYVHRDLSRLFLFIFLGVAALSLSVADNLALGLYRLIKILEFVGLYFYVQSSLGKIIGIRESFLAVIVSGFFQSVMAIGQSLFQHNLGLKWLGESVLRTNFAGVAVVPTLAGLPVGEAGKFLRAYGTTPHPNVLASWLFLAIFAFYFLFLYCTQKSTETIDQRQRGTLFATCLPAGRARETKSMSAEASRDYFVLIVYPILLWGLFSTFSRVAIGLLMAGMAARLLIIWLKRKKYLLSPSFKRHLRLLFVITAAVTLILGFFYWPQVRSRFLISAQDQAVSQRIFYVKTAGEMILGKSWLGVGLGQFVATMMVTLKNYPSYVYQPVHNIYLLIMSETGFLGLTAFIGWLAVLFYEYIKSTRFKELHQVSFFIVFSSILIMGLFDHFLWTLQQGQLIFWMTLGLIAASSKNQEK